MKMKDFIKDKRGSVDLFFALAGALLLVGITVIAIAGFKLYARYTTLNTFANQYIHTIAEEGCTSNNRITKRYAELSESTGLSPTVTYEAVYVSGSSTKVQYGDVIKITMTVDTHVSACGFSLPVTLKITKTAESEQYWK